MSDDALHLRMGLVACHQQHCALSLRPGGDVLDLLHKGAGCIVVDQGALLQRVVDAAGHTVAADDDFVPGGDVIHRVGHQRPPALHIGHSLRVVDERPQRCHLVALIQQVIRQLHRPVHTEAEARRLRQTNLHVILLS